MYLPSVRYFGEFILGKMYIYINYIYWEIWLTLYIIFASYVERSSEEEVIKNRERVECVNPSLNLSSRLCVIFFAHTLSRADAYISLWGRDPPFCGKFCPFSTSPPSSESRALIVLIVGKRERDETRIYMYSHVTRCTLSPRPKTPLTRLLDSLLLEKGVERSRSTRSDNKWCFICRAMPGGYRHVDGGKKEGENCNATRRQSAFSFAQGATNHVEAALSG